jgi:hypothetical protein
MSILTRLGNWAALKIVNWAEEPTTEFIPLQQFEVSSPDPASLYFELIMGAVREAVEELGILDVQICDSPDFSDPFSRLRIVSIRGVYGDREIGVSQKYVPGRAFGTANTLCNQLREVVNCS